MSLRYLVGRGHPRGPTGRAAPHESPVRDLAAPVPAGPAWS